MDESDERRLREAIAVERDRVRDQIANLERSFTSIVDAAELTSTDDEHDPEGTTIAYERAQVSALLDQARDDLVALDVAVARVDAGLADVCAVCGGSVGIDRLLALPGVVTCVRCAG
ncbi:MAG TPA: TraR/DksA C4-type zinc finger protein [Ilumatobacteraceae bacterium]